MAMVIVRAATMIMMLATVMIRIMYTLGSYLTSQIIKFTEVHPSLPKSTLTDAKSVLPTSCDDKHDNDDSDKSDEDDTDDNDGSDENDESDNYGK